VQLDRILIRKPNKHLCRKKIFSKIAHMNKDTTKENPSIM